MADDKNFTKDKNFFVLNSMDDWVRILDSDGKTMFINESFKMARQTSKELESYLKEENSFILKNRIDAIKRSTMIEEKFIDGKYYSIKTSPIFEKEKFMGVVEVYRDITRESLMKIELFNANRDMLDDLRLVKRIQKNILPKDRTYSRLVLKSKYLPSDNLSGDFYDLIKISPDKYALYIADVMGHGVKASMITMFIKVTMNAIFDKHPDYSPSKALVNLREKFADLKLDSSLYFTAWLGIFDFNKNTLTFANAGHNCPPIIYSKKRDKLEYLLVSGRMISNIIEPDIYDEKEYKIYDEDKILLFSDGAVEGKDENKKEFGILRLKESFAKGHDIEKIYEDISNFLWGKQEDDLTLVEVSYIEQKE